MYYYSERKTELIFFCCLSVVFFIILFCRVINEIILIYLKNITRLQMAVRQSAVGGYHQCSSCV